MQQKSAPDQVRYKLAGNGEQGTEAGKKIYSPIFAPKNNLHVT
jgi:hypothetical protein